MNELHRLFCLQKLPLQELSQLPDLQQWQIRFMQDLQLRGMSERTQETYVRSLRQLSEYCNRPPDQITEEQVRDYFLYTRNEKNWSRTASTIAICGIKSFFDHTLKRKWTILGLLRAPYEKKLPVV